jgi:hypothetical protein
LRSVFKNGSCSSCPLLLMVAPAFSYFRGYFNRFPPTVPSGERARRGIPGPYDFRAT